MLTCFQVWLFPMFLFVVPFKTNMYIWGLMAGFFLKIVFPDMVFQSVFPDKGSLAKAT